MHFDKPSNQTTVQQFSSGIWRNAYRFRFQSINVYFKFVNMKIKNVEKAEDHVRGNTCCVLRIGFRYSDLDTERFYQ